MDTQLMLQVKEILKNFLIIGKRKNYKDQSLSMI